MSNLLTSELHTLSQDFLPSKLYRWRADIQALIAGISRTAHEFNKVCYSTSMVGVMNSVHSSKLFVVFVVHNDWHPGVGSKTGQSSRCVDGAMKTIVRRNCSLSSGTLTVRLHCVRLKNSNICNRGTTAGHARGAHSGMLLNQKLARCAN